jgi:hypothetical protein
MTLNYQTVPGFSPNLPPELLRTAITPLRLIFWGGLLVIFDFTFTTTTNGRGFRCDVLDDTLGMILITVGVFRLARFPVPGSYRTMMSAINVIAVLGIIRSVDHHFIYDSPDWFGLMGMVLVLAELAAVILFCTCMRRLALEAGLRGIAASWAVTRLLFLALYVLPLGLFYLAALGAVVTGRSFHINLGPAGLLLLLIFVIPCVHLFVSTSRFKRALA